MRERKKNVCVHTEWRMEEADRSVKCLPWFLKPKVAKCQEKGRD